MLFGSRHLNTCQGSLQSHLRCANIGLPKAPADVPLARSINLSHPSHSMIEPGLTNQTFSLRCCDMSLRFSTATVERCSSSSRTSTRMTALCGCWLLLLAAAAGCCCCCCCCCCCGLTPPSPPPPSRVRVKSLASSRKICTLTQPTYITGTSTLRRAMIARRCHRSNAARYCDCHCGCIAADQKVNRSQLDEAPPAPPGFSPGWQ